MKTPLKKILLCAALPALLLSACGGSDDNADDRLGLADPKIRLVHAVPLAPDVTLYRNDQGVAPELSGLSYKEASPYVTISSGPLQWDVKTDTTPAVEVGGVNFEGDRGHKYTLVALPGAGGATGVALIDDPYNKSVVSDNARVRLFNASFNATGLDAYLSAPGADLATLQPNFAGVNYQTAVPASTQDATEFEGATYQLRLTTAGTKTVVFSASVNIAKNADLLLTTVPASISANDVKVLVVQDDGEPAVELTNAP